MQGVELATDRWAILLCNQECVSNSSGHRWGELGIPSELPESAGEVLVTVRLPAKRFFSFGPEGGTETL
jgi:hypothetical protein